MQTRFDRFCGAGHGLCRRWGPASADPTDSTSGEGLFGRSHCEATAGRRKQLTAAVFEQTGHDLGCSNMVNLETVQANSVFFRVVVFVGECWRSQITFQQNLGSSWCLQNKWAILI